MFTVALFTIAKTWGQPKRSLTDEWIKKMWCIYTTGYHSAMKKNEIMSFATTWVNLDTDLLSEVSQKEKVKYSRISLICQVQKMIQMNLFTKQKQTQILREQKYGCEGGNDAGEG